jgi:hypothetical protein
VSSCANPNPILQGQGFTKTSMVELANSNALADAAPVTRF